LFAAAILAGEDAALAGRLQAWRQRQSDAVAVEPE
jgi:5-(carboxyamino)imidazole ribonucleotide mutase